MQKKSYAVILSAIMLTACGGGGGAGGMPSLVRTSITGTVVPPVAPASGPAAASANVLVPPNSTGTWPSIMQGASYTFDPAAPAKVASVNVLAVDTRNGTTTVGTGAAYPGDATLGQLTSIQHSLTGVTIATASTSALVP